MWTWICLILPPGIRILNIICIHIPVFRRRSEWTGLSWTGRRFELISQSRSGRTPPPPACTWADPPGESPGTTAKEGEGVYFFFGGGVKLFSSVFIFHIWDCIEGGKIQGCIFAQNKIFLPYPLFKNDIFNFFPSTVKIYFSSFPPLPPLFLRFFSKPYFSPSNQYFIFLIGAEGMKWKYELLIILPV